MKQIANGLWQGALRHVYEQGLPEGVDTVILMATQVEPVPIKPDTLFIYFPIDDDPQGTSEYNMETMLAISRLARDRNVLTICHMGENRSGFMSVLVLVARGIDIQDAVHQVQTLGPVNSPTKGHSFWNPGFCAQALEYYTEEI